MDQPLGNDPDAVEALRGALDTAGYTSDQILEATGRRILQLVPDQVPVALHRLPPGEALSTLISLFLLDVEVPSEDAEAALAPLGVAGAAALGLIVTVADGRVRSSVRLLPYAGLVVAADKVRWPHPEPDHVMGPAASTSALTNCAVRSSGRVLEVGTGSGAVALLAARHAEAVVATDTNPRALAFARFNIALNDLANVELRLGDRFEPVGRERFDLILCNPPYVISPEASFAYRDSGLRGDTFSRELVGAAATHLADGGVAQLMVSWSHPRDDWVAPLRGWVDGLGCDAWFLYFGSEDPVEYAATWNYPLRSDLAAFGEAVDRWVAYFHAESIDAIGSGMVILRPGGGHATPIEVGSVRLASSGGHVRRIIDAGVWLAGLDDDAVLDARLHLGPHRLEQVLRWREGAFEVDGNELVMELGLPLRRPVDTPTLALLGHLDGQRTVAEAAEAAARMLEGPDADVAGFARAAAQVARGMLAQGILVRP